MVRVREAVERELADEESLKERRLAAEASLVRARATETELEELLRADVSLLSRAHETWFALSGLRERLRGTAGLAAERVRNAAELPC